MARIFTSRPASIRYYLGFLILVFVTSVVSLVIYIVSEHQLLRGNKERSSVERLQGKLTQNSVFLQKLHQLAALRGDNRTQRVPGSALRNKFLVTLHQNESSKSQKTFHHLADKMQAQALHQNESSKSQKTVHHSADNMQAHDQSAKLKSGDNWTLNYNVHMFYYPWYGNPETDGEYIHWNHRYLPHWRKEEVQKWPLSIHVPPGDIGSNFYPALGPYSSADPAIVNKHMMQVRSSGAGVIVVSWYPPDQADENSQPFDRLIPLLLDSAHRHEVKVAIHIEPYKDRNGETLNQHVRYILDSYGQHPGFYRREVGGKQLPVFYIYDSYQIDSRLWAQALKPGGKHCLRGTQYDGIFLGLYLGPKDERKLLASGFDGFYTYFAANGFTKGSSWSNWRKMATSAAKNNLLFVPSVGPGYVDTRIRPWNAQTTRKRLDGKYFRQSFQAALDANVELISVTSFNEWHEGTQVEPAVPKTVDGFTYEDYSPGGPDFYLQLLKEYVGKFSQLQG